MHGHLKPQLSQRLWFRVRGRSVPRGWYLFVIRHRGNNPRVMGWLKSGTWGHCQGRPMYPVRDRLRVIHLNRPRQLTLELRGVSEPLIIDRLWLFRLPSLDAWRRIKKRLNTVDQFLTSSSTIRWRYYNQLLNGQSGCGPRISYTRWQQHVEAPLLQVLPDITEACRQQFVVQNPCQISRVNHDQWVILLRPDVHLAIWALSMLQQRLGGLTTHEAPLVLFGDEDFIALTGERHSPRFKPAWNLELFWADPEFSNHWIVQGDIWNGFLEAKSIDINNWWCLQYGLIQHMYDHALSARIKHLPIVLAAV